MSGAKTWPRAAHRRFPIGRRRGVYEVRKLKEQTGGQFSEGVYALYAQDFSGAKRIFLKLVHQNADDGGARYYLYLADRLEKHPETEISLDPER